MGSARLFERMHGMDPRQYTPFSLEAPDSFFYTLYGGMAAVSEQAKQRLARMRDDVSVAVPLWDG